MLEDQYARDQIAYLHDDPSWSTERLVRLCNHPQSTIRVISGHLPFGIHNLIEKPCSYVTFLRDPVELLISMYSYIRSSPVIPTHKKVIQMSFRQFMECGELNDLTSNIQTRYLTGMPRLYVHQPGWQYFSWKPGVCLPDVNQAKEHLKSHFSFVGITERLSQDDPYGSCVRLAACQTLL